MAIVTMTLEEVMAIPEEELEAEEASVERELCTYDPDCPPSTDEDLKRFHRVNPHKRRA